MSSSWFCFEFFEKSVVYRYNFTNRIERCLYEPNQMHYLLWLVDSPVDSLDSAEFPPPVCFFFSPRTFILSSNCPFHLLNAVIFYNALSGSKVKYMIERRQSLRIIAESNSTQLRLRRMTWIISFIAKGHLFKNFNFNSSTFSIAKKFSTDSTSGIFRLT